MDKPLRRLGPPQGPWIARLCVGQQCLAIGRVDPLVDIGQRVEPERLEVIGLGIARLVRLEACREDLQRAMQLPEHWVPHTTPRERSHGLRRLAIVLPTTRGARPHNIGEHPGQLLIADRGSQEVVGPQLEHIGQVAQLPPQTPDEDQRNIVSPVPCRVHERSRVGLPQADQHCCSDRRRRDPLTELTFAHRRDRVPEVLDAGDEAPALAAIADDEDLRGQGRRSVPQADGRSRAPQTGKNCPPGA